MEASVAEVSVVEVSLALLVRNFFDGWNERRIEDAASVEISVAMEGAGVDVLDGAIGGVAEESFAVEATVEYS